MGPAFRIDALDITSGPAGFRKVSPDCRSLFNDNRRFFCDDMASNLSPWDRENFTRCRTSKVLASTIVAILKLSEPKVF